MLEGIPGIAAHFYNALAAGALREFYGRIASEIVGQIQSGRILDVGTGPGYLPLEIVKRDGRLDTVAIDISPAMIEIARENAKRVGIGRIKFEVADVHNLPYEDNSFDFLISTISLHHWRDKRHAFNECYRVLKDGGMGWIYELRKDAGWKKRREVIKGYSLPELYLSFALRFHGLKTKDLYSEVRNMTGKSRFREIYTKEKGPFICMRLRK